MKKILYCLVVVVLIVLNLIQWYRMHHVSARPAIVFAWSEADGYFNEETNFEQFQEKVSSQEFIRSIIDKPKYKSIRDQFLEDWNPEITRSKVSDLTASPYHLYWGRERDLLSDLIDEIYTNLKLELTRYQK
ncbi:MAG: hypothetical protein JXA82_12155 [Sedimentisphaerales bacterium]|nr:hypothetical protein [Sedimentisphaerales bacterium]